MLVLFHVAAVAESPHVVQRVASTCPPGFDVCHIVGLWITVESRGLHKRDTTLVFDPRGKSILDERNLRSNETKHQETDSPACVTDVLSGIYYIGAQRLEPGLSYLVPVNDGGKTFDTTVYVEGREDVKTDAGTFHTVRVAVYSDAGPLKGRGKIWLWFTDDASHLPVQMRSRLFWGTMTLRLTQLEK